MGALGRGHGLRRSLVLDSVNQQQPAEIQGWVNYKLWVGPRTLPGRGPSWDGTGRGIGWHLRPQEVSEIKAGLGHKRVGLRKRVIFRESLTHRSTSFLSTYITSTF